MGIQLEDVENSREKIKLVFSYWKETKDDVFHKSNVFCVIAGKANKSEDATPQERFQIWLNGYQLTETFIVFLKNQEKVLILASDKKKDFLSPLLKSDSSIEFFQREGDDSGNLSNIRKAIEKEGGSDIALLKDAEAHGTFFENCYSFVKGFNKKEGDASTAVQGLMNFRSKSDIKVQKSAGDIACMILKTNVIANIEEALDNEEYESHDKIKDKAIRFLENKKCVNKLKDKLKVDLDEIEVVYSTVQSGNKFVLSCKNSDDKNYLSSNEGTIIVGVGVKYKELCCNVTRTLILNAKTQHKELYNFTLNVLKHIVSECLKVGTSFSSVYKKVIEYIEKNKESECPSLKSVDLKAHFVKSVGHPIGLEFSQRNFLIKEHNDKVYVNNSTTYNISVGFENVEGNDKKIFATWISETVAVDDVGEIQVLTSSSSTALQTALYELESDSEGEDEEGEETSRHGKNRNKDKNGDVKKKIGISSSILNNAASVIVSDRLRRRNKNSLAHSNEQEIEELKKRQQVLRENKINEIKSKFAKGKVDFSNLSKKNIKRMQDLKAFSEPENFPKDLKPNKIHIDHKHSCILVPVNGIHIPFHVSTIKNLSCNFEDSSRLFMLRVNFLVPGAQGTSKGDINEFPVLDGKEMYIKELIFKSKEEKHFQSIVKQVKDLIKLVKQREEEADVMDSKGLQDKLILNKGARRIILKDLMCKPPLFTGRKIIGHLELHTNGLRYIAHSKGSAECIDIVFDDIKHAFYQPCDGQLVVVIHFHLKRFIMVGKKKTTDVQFYKEVGNQVDDVEVRGRNMYDPDETRGEMEERQNKLKYNAIFKSFVQSIQDASQIEFEIPYPELTFSGVPNKSNVEIFVTANTVNHLLEWPPFVLSVEDIEIASLERVHHGLRNFDLVFVFKDYTKPVKRIDVIPIEHIDTIKKWLTTIDIVYYEGKNNLQWTNILKTILADTEAFVESKGFEGFLGDDDEEEEEEEDVDEDEEYEIEESEEELEEDSDYDDSDDESLAPESEEEEEFEEEESEDEGLSWDELEERAKKEDRKRFGMISDEEEGDRGRRKRRR